MLLLTIYDISLCLSAYWQDEEYLICVAIAVHRMQCHRDAAFIADKHRLESTVISMLTSEALDACRSAAAAPLRTLHTRTKHYSLTCSWLLLQLSSFIQPSESTDQPADAGWTAGWPRVGRRTLYKWINGSYPTHWLQCAAGDMTTATQLFLHITEYSTMASVG